MKVQLAGPGSGYMPEGYRSWQADEVWEVDDADEAAVAYYRGAVANGSAVLLEDVKPPKPASPAQPTQAPEVTLAELREQAKAKGLPTYGTKAELAERLADADE
jgi:hypothetical protein